MARGGRARVGTRGKSRVSAVRNPGNGSTTFANAGAVTGKTSTGSVRKNTIAKGLPNGAGSQSDNWKA